MPALRKNVTPWLFLFLLILAPLRGAAPSVVVTDVTWHDAARNRDVPARIYSPKTGGPFPVIIFSHGLGGSREGYSYLGNEWAAHGYISVHVQHLGSDSAVAHSIASMKEALRDTDNLINRPKDISFAIDEVTALNAAPGPWHDKFDLARIGVAGHSFGAYTTMAIAGEKISASQTLADPRVKAVIAMSTPHIATAQYKDVHIPAMHWTGTEDVTRIVGVTDKAADRRIPFDQSSGPDTYLVIFQGGDHMVFSGRQRLMPGGAGKNDAVFHDLILKGTTAFWDAYLKGDAKAKDWLANGGFSTELGQNATFEKK